MTVAGVIGFAGVTGQIKKPFFLWDAKGDRHLVGTVMYRRWSPVLEALVVHRKKLLPVHVVEVVVGCWVALGKDTENTLAIKKTVRGCGQCQ